jgi:hypothetical protein
MHKIRKCLLVLFTFGCLGAIAQLQSSNLPIVIINTGGLSIPDDPKILVQLKIIYNGEGKVNNLTDAPNHYDSYVGIELRGSSSQMFPKKPYGLELRDKNGNENPQEIFGMPKEADWILYASYNEKSLMHNVLTMSFGRQLGMYASRTKYVELILNGQYQGVYVWMERIKRDKGRVDIATLRKDDISGDQLTGGYILKIDKSTGTNIGSFRSKYPNLNNNFSTYFYHSPKSINEIQKRYIREEVGRFEDAIASNDYKDPIKGYRNLIDIQSFVKLFLINEVSRNIDGYRISSFLYKDRDSKNPKIVAGPPWDYDISYGNADYCQGNRYDLFAYRFNEICPNDFWLVPFYWQKMVNDPFFVGELRNIYFKERESGGVFDITRVHREIDEMANEIRDAQKRNFQKWPILGVYIWPNPRPVATSWELEVLELKNWVAARLLWLDQNLPREFVITANEFENNQFQVTAFPNPFVDKIYLNLKSPAATLSKITLTDVLGKIILEQDLELKEGDQEHELVLENFTSMQSVVILKIQTSEGQVVMNRLVGKL